MTISKKTKKPSRRIRTMNDNKDTYNGPLETRVGRLEGAMETLTRAVQETSHNVREIAVNMNGFKEDVLSHIGTATAPKWPIIISWVSVTLTLLIMAGATIGIMLSGQSDMIRTNQANIVELRQRDYDQRFTDGKFEQALTTLLEEHNQNATQ